MPLLPILLALVTAAAVVLAPPSRPARDSIGIEFDAATTSELQQVLDGARADAPIVGLAGAVAAADGRLWTAGSGASADHSGGSLVTPSTPFVVGSITKTFVAATVLQLVEEGRISLDDPLVRWMPDYPNGAAITVRQLLAHTSGIYNYFEHPDYERRVFRDAPTSPWTVPDILALVRAPYFAPGRGYHYSNTNYVLLGVVIERETGDDLAAEIRRRFLEPLQLHDTYLQGEEAIPVEVAEGYLYDGSRFVSQSDGTALRPNTAAATSAWAAGGMVSSARDLAKWTTLLYGGRVLQPASLAAMTAFAPSAYGLGARLHHVDARPAWGHGGSLRGFTAAIWYLPDQGVTSVVLTNRGRISPSDLTDRLARVVLARWFPDMTPPRVRAPAANLTTGVALAPAGMPVRLSWAATETESGVGEYTLERRVDTGPWTEIALSRPAATTASPTLPVGHTYQFRVTARDAAGNTSPVAAATPFRLSLVQDGGSRMSYGGAWRRTASLSASGGAQRRTSQRGATASVTTSGTQLAWIARKGPGSGRATVSVGGVIAATVDLYDPLVRWRRSVYVARPTDADVATVRVTALATADRPIVDVDAFVVLRPVPSP